MVLVQVMNSCTGLSVRKRCFELGKKQGKKEEKKAGKKAIRKGRRSKMFCCMQISSYQFCQHFFSASKGTAVSSVIKNLTIKITDQIQRAKI